MVEAELSDIDFRRFVPPGGLVAWGQGCAEPVPVTQALMAQRRQIGRFRVFIGGSFADSVDPDHADDVAYMSYIGMGRNADLARAGKLAILPCAYSQIADALSPVDLLIVQAAQGPDGRLRYAIACEYLGDLERRARAIIVEINADAPWSPDAPEIDKTRIVAVVRTARAPIELPPSEPDDTMQQIGAIVAGLVEDGATLQIGVGTLPEAVLRSLGSHRDLGIHSGAIGDGVAALIEAGVVNNARKTVDTGVSVAGVFFGGARLNRLAHANRAIRLAPTSYTHDPRVIAGIDRFVSLNSAIEVDLYGAVNSEVANGAYLGGVGGAGEFTRAAALSRGGCPIIAMSSTAARGKVSRITAKLSGPTTISRSDAGIVVTEFGAADLRGRSLEERRRLMVSLAHPDFREQLDAVSMI
ncbi:acetyl-CoA hydrolase/transferase family protein [Rhizobium sp. C4]|uniref:acetyl-CoA hydrolase/transferase family protein n=1 Tax=Rhizobium sp. C4 TaxID=1349800 RepID=UPI001E4A4524|nr:acetyl-CoA hydrolase/transferase C-terminal domain-containing protein [Rhizobium sp. C4]MCD2172207.1 acetyl-CoA hydrolase [Rhizobium sp. C4]